MWRRYGLFLTIRRAYLRKPIHYSHLSQLAGLRLCAAYRLVDLRPSNDIAQVESRPNSNVALAGECNVVQAEQTDNNLSKFRAFDPCRPSVARWGLANCGGNRDGQLFDRSAANEMRCCYDCGVLILIENRVVDHVEESPSKGSKRPVCLLSCSLNGPMAAGHLRFPPVPLGW